MRQVAYWDKMVKNMPTFGVTVFSFNAGVHDVITEITASSYTCVTLLCEYSCEPFRNEVQRPHQKEKNTTKYQHLDHWKICPSIGKAAAKPEDV